MSICSHMVTLREVGKSCERRYHGSTDAARCSRCEDNIAARTHEQFLHRYPFTKRVPLYIYSGGHIWVQGEVVKTCERCEHGSTDVPRCSWRLDNPAARTHEQFLRHYPFTTWVPMYLWYTPIGLHAFEYVRLAPVLSLGSCRHPHRSPRAPLIALGRATGVLGGMGYS